MRRTSKARVLAIDPGASGGLAWLNGIGRVEAKPMPDGLTAQVDLLRAFRGTEYEVWMEKVGQHVQGNNASASAKFARHCGQLEGALYALNVPVRQVTPLTWQKALGPLPKEKADRKRAIRDEMARRFPHLKVTLRTADALGILEWALGN